MVRTLRHIGLAGGAFVILLLAALASMVRVGSAPPSQPVPPTVIAQPAAAPVHLASVAAPAQVAPDPNAVDDHPLLAVPVQGVDRTQIHDSWGDPRENGLREHHGTDIMAAQNTPVLAAAAGTVEKLFYSNGGGGITLYVRSPDRLWMYYYAHLSGYAPGLHEGQVVQPGEPLAFVGDTGNAGTGNFHLHFGMSRMRPEERWWQGEAVNPYRLLAGTGDPR